MSSRRPFGRRHDYPFPWEYDDIQKPAYSNSPDLYEDLIRLRKYYNHLINDFLILRDDWEKTKEGFEKLGEDLEATIREEINRFIEWITKIIADAEAELEEMRILLEEGRALTEENRRLTAENRAILEESRPLLEESRTLLEEVRLLMTEVRAYIAETREALEEIREIHDDVSKKHEDINGWYEEIKIWYEDIKNIYEDIKQKHTEITIIYEEIKRIYEEISDLIGESRFEQVYEQVMPKSMWTSIETIADPNIATDLSQLEHGPYNHCLAVENGLLTWHDKPTTTNYIPFMRFYNNAGILQYEKNWNVDWNHVMSTIQVPTTDDDDTFSFLLNIHLDTTNNAKYAITTGHIAGDSLSFGTSTTTPSSTNARLGVDTRVTNQFLESRTVGTSIEISRKNIDLNNFAITNDATFQPINLATATNGGAVQAIQDGIFYIIDKYLVIASAHEAFVYKILPDNKVVIFMASAAIDSLNNYYQENTNLSTITYNTRRKQAILLFKQITNNLTEIADRDKRVKLVYNTLSFLPKFDGTYDNYQPTSRYMFPNDNSTPTIYISTSGPRTTTNNTLQNIETALELALYYPSDITIEIVDYTNFENTAYILFNNLIGITLDSNDGALLPPIIIRHCQQLRFNNVSINTIHDNPFTNVNTENQERPLSDKIFKAGVIITDSFNISLFQMNIAPGELLSDKKTFFVSADNSTIRMLETKLDLSSTLKYVYRAEDAEFYDDEYTSGTLRHSNYNENIYGIGETTAPVNGYAISIRNQTMNGDSFQITDPNYFYALERGNIRVSGKPTVNNYTAFDSPIDNIDINDIRNGHLNFSSFERNKQEIITVAGQYRYDTKNNTFSYLAENSFRVDTAGTEVTVRQAVIENIRGGY